MEQKEELISIINTLSEKQTDTLIRIARVITDAIEVQTDVKYLTTEEAAEQLGVTSATIRSYIKSGRLDGRRLSPRRFVVSSDSVERNRFAQTRF